MALPPSKAVVKAWVGKVIQKCSGNRSVHAKAGLAVFRLWVHGGLWRHTEQNVPESVRESSGIIINVNGETVVLLLPDFFSLKRNKGKGKEKGKEES